MSQTIKAAEAAKGQKIEFADHFRGMTLVVVTPYKAYAKSARGDYGSMRVRAAQPHSKTFAISVYFADAATVIA